MFMATHAVQRHVVVYIVSVWQNKQAKSEEFSVCALSDQDSWMETKKTGFEAWVESVNPSVRLGRLDWPKPRELLEAARL